MLSLPPAVARKTRPEKLGTVKSHCELGQAGHASPLWPTKEGKHMEMVPGEAIAVLDGGRKGIDRDVLKSLTNSVSGKALTRVRNDYLMVYTEEGLSGRRERVRGIINQVETLSVFTFNGMVMAKRNSKHYTGSNYGNIIGPCSVMSFDDKDLWLLDPAAKKAL